MKKSKAYMIGKYCMPKCIKMVRADNPFDFPFILQNIKGNTGFFVDCKGRLFTCKLEHLLFEK
jgi:hypothetical protein